MSIDPKYLDYFVKATEKAARRAAGSQWEAHRGGSGSRNDGERRRRDAWSSASCSSGSWRGAAWDSGNRKDDSKAWD